jgi:large subunit ribosomal protein L22
MPGLKTNERPGTRSVLRHYRMSATKARQVLDLIRGEDVQTAHEILRTTTREGARVVDKVLHSAISNAVEMSRQAGAAIDPDELYVSACYADEGTTLKRWRPRARGRATRIRKRTCHITVIVSRLDDERIARLRVKRTEATAALRGRRVAASRLRRRGGGAGGADTGADSGSRSGSGGVSDSDSDSDSDVSDEEVSDEAVSEDDVSDDDVIDETGDGDVSDENLADEGLADDDVVSGEAADEDEEAEGDDAVDAQADDEVDDAGGADAEDEDKDAADADGES